MTNAMELSCSFGNVRTWRDGDEAGLVRHLNNRNVWLQLRDQLPFPYTIDDAEQWIEFATAEEDDVHLAIDVGGEVVGGIGFAFEIDVNRCSAEIGYWIGEAFWGLGIATEALTVVTRFALATHSDLLRLFALPFADNAASRRVLEKAGYELEGILHDAAIKDGKVRDQAIYARLRRSDPRLSLTYPRWEE